MILIIGGCASGKRTFAQKLGYSRTDMKDAELPATVVYNAQNLIPREEDPKISVPTMFGLLDCDVVILNEVGNGVHPLDRAERDWRELVGRVTCDLADKADVVIRMVCGIPTVLKGELPCN